MTNSPETRIGVADLDDIAVGGAILGTGGGGHPCIGMLMAQHAIRRHGPVRLRDVAELADDDLVVPCATTGAPTVMIEKNSARRRNPHRVPEARMVSRPQDRRDPLRRGGRPQLDYSVRDRGDDRSARRRRQRHGPRYPELQMVTFTLHGVSATPMVIVDDKVNSALLECIDNRWTERLARTATIEMGGSVLIRPRFGWARLLRLQDGLSPVPRGLSQARRRRAVAAAATPRALEKLSI